MGGDAAGAGAGDGDGGKGAGAAGGGEGATGATGAGAGGAGLGVGGAEGAGDGGGAGALVTWWGLVGIGTNSPARQVWGMRRMDGSFRNRSAWPHPRQIRVPSDSSPRERSESEPPPIVPVFSSFTQTKSVAPQFVQTGATEST